MLYFHPPAGAWPPTQGASGAYVSSASNLVILRNGTTHLTFQGISWQHTRSTVITTATGAVVSDITIDSCTVANSGGGGISLIGYRNIVTDSKVFNIASTGISVKGGLHRSLTRGDNLVRGNEIHHYAQWYRTYQPGILWAGVGNTYSLNHIHDAPHNGECVLRSFVLSYLVGLALLCGQEFWAGEMRRPVTQLDTSQRSSKRCAVGTTSCLNPM